MAENPLNFVIKRKIKKLKNQQAQQTLRKINANKTICRQIFAKWIKPKKEREREKNIENRTK